MNSFRRNLLVAGSILVSLAGSSPAAAQAHHPAAAEVLFDKGRAAAAHQDWRQACSAFEQSQELEPATGTLLNLGECHYQLGVVATAWQDFVEAVRELAPSDPRRAFAERRVAELEKRLPRLTVALDPQAPAGTSVTKNGVAMPPATMGLEVPVNPGTVSVIVNAPGRRPRSYSLSAREGQSERLDVTAGAPEAASSPDSTKVRPAGREPPAPAPVEQGPSGARSFGFVLTGIGIAGLAAGGVLVGSRSTAPPSTRASAGPRSRARRPSSSTPPTGSRAT